MNLRELVDTVDVPETRVAEEAWRIATRRVRRRRSLAATAAAAVGVTVVLVSADAMSPDSDQRPPTPVTGTPAPSPAPSTSAADEHLPVSIIRPDWGAWDQAIALGPSADAPLLSEDPVSHAALVMGDPEDQATAYVLGDDGRWRRLDVPGLVPVSDGLYTSSLVVPTALDPSGTRLAVPQPDALVVVDLTSGAARRYGVKGYWHHALWVDDDHVLIAREGDETGRVVGLVDGAVEGSELGPSSRVLPDGSTLTWPRGERTFWWNGEARQSAVNNSGFQQVSPQVRDDLVVVLNLGGSMSDPAPAYPPQELTSTAGVAAVDLASGDPVGYVQLSEALESKGTFSTLLGWRGEDPVLGLVDEAMSSIRTFVVVWDVDAGVLEPLATVPSWSLSWGVGL